MTGSFSIPLLLFSDLEAEGQLFSDGIPLLLSDHYRLISVAPLPFPFLFDSFILTTLTRYIHSTICWCCWLFRWKVIDDTLIDIRYITNFRPRLPFRLFVHHLELVCHLLINFAFLIRWFYIRYVHIPTIPFVQAFHSVDGLIPHVVTGVYVLHSDRCCYSVFIWGGLSHSVTLLWWWLSPDQMWYLCWLSPHGERSYIPTNRYDLFE